MISPVIEVISYSPANLLKALRSLGKSKNQKSSFICREKVNGDFLLVGILKGCGFSPYSWKLPAYSPAFLLTVVIGSLFAYSWSFLTYSWSSFAYSWS